MVKSFRFYSLYLVVGLLLLGLQDLRAQWTKHIFPHFRTANDVVLVDSLTVVGVGGNRFNDAIRTIAISYDRSTSWNIVEDGIAQWVKAVYKVNANNLIAVGDTGSVLRSTNKGTNWNVISGLPVVTQERQLNSVFFVDSNVGYIAAGSLQLDSMQTIFKTIDGGLTWAVNRDTLGAWLNKIYFLNADTGFAVGNKGMVLQTVDAGTSWKAISMPGNTATRTFNDVLFVNSSLGFVVGGNKTNDSIQTILKTNDLGQTWSILSDNLGSMLNDIAFVNDTIGYIVGDKGEVLTTNDAGNSWSSLGLTSQLTDDQDLLAVTFWDEDFGLIVGRNGVILRTLNLAGKPNATTLNSENVAATSAKINGLVVANNKPTYTTFEYGVTTALGTSVVATPDSIFGTDTTYVSAQLSGLQPNTFYYYRVNAENIKGNRVGDIKSFYTGDCIIPNCGFEEWDSVSLDYPTGWMFVGSVSKTTSYNGSTAIRLATEEMPYNSSGKQGSAIVYGDVANDKFGAYLGLSSGRPDSLVFWANYNVAAGDTAFGVVIFKRNGQPWFFHKAPMVGSSGGNWQRISSYINYPSADMPDSVLVGITSNNIFIDSVVIPGSVVLVDDVKLTGIADTIPNSNFESSSTTTFNYPLYWNTSESDNGFGIDSGIKTIQQTTDRIEGNFAIRLETDPEANRDCMITIGEMRQNNYTVPGFKVGGRYSTFNFYAKFLPQNSDTLNAYVFLIKNGQAIGNAWYSIISTTPSYTPFSVPIWYMNPNDIPDSAIVQFQIRIEDQGTKSSVAYIDNLSFDGFRAIDSTLVGIKKSGSLLSDLMCNIYPNPAKSNLNIEYFNNRAGETQINILDLTGRVVFSSTKQSPQGMAKTQIDIANFATGTYYVSIKNELYFINRKIMIAH